MDNLVPPKTNKLGLIAGLSLIVLTTVGGSIGAYKWMEKKYGDESHAKYYALLWGGLAGLYVGSGLLGGEGPTREEIQRGMRESRKKLPPRSSYDDIDDTRTSGEYPF